MEAADFPYVSCNFYSEADGIQGENVLGSYEVFELGGVSVAIIGITTPESFTKSTPAYFQDDDGDYIYGIAGGPDGEELYDAVQEAIDSASVEADYVIALGHLGVDESSQPWTSREVIATPPAWRPSSTATPTLPSPFFPCWADGQSIVREAALLWTWAMAGGSPAPRDRHVPLPRRQRRAPAGPGYHRRRRPISGNAGMSGAAVDHIVPSPLRRWNARSKISTLIST